MIGKTHNVNMALANTEYNFKVPANTKYLLIKTRQGLADLKMAYEAGKSGSVYITVPATSTKTMTGSDVQTMSDIILYFQSTSPDVVEIETWQ